MNPALDARTRPSPLWVSALGSLISPERLADQYQTHLPPVSRSGPRRAANPAQTTNPRDARHETGPDSAQ